MSAQNGRRLSPAPRSWRNAARRMGVNAAVLLADRLPPQEDGSPVWGQAFWFRGRKVIVVVRLPDPEQMIHTLIHEALHWLREDIPTLAVNGRGRPYYINRKANPRRLTEDQIDAEARLRLVQARRRWESVRWKMDTGFDRQMVNGRRFMTWRQADDLLAFVGA